MTPKRFKDENIPPSLLKAFKAEFKGKTESWVKRCVKRLKDVDRLDPNTWIVKGRLSLGDHEAEYKVFTVHHHYQCTCWDPDKPFSNARRIGVCSHVGAVILYRLLHQ